MPEKRSSSVQSVERAIAILKTFSPDEQELGVGELSRRLDLPKSTVFRLLSTLDACGFVAQNPITDLYRLGLDLIPLANSVVGNTDLRQIARPYLKKLVNALGETADLSVMRSGEVIHLDQIEYHGRLVMRSGGTGRRMPFYATSAGKAFAAFLSEEVLESLLDTNYEQMTTATITNPNELKNEFASVRKDGFATAFEEMEEGLHSVSAPIRDHEGDVIACTSISGPSYRLSRDRIKEVAPQVVLTSLQISRELGYAENGV